MTDATPLSAPCCENCGRPAEPQPNPHSAYFCSEHCRQTFDAQFSLLGELGWTPSPEGAYTYERVFPMPTDSTRPLRFMDLHQPEPPYDPDADRNSFLSWAFALTISTIFFLISAIFYGLNLPYLSQPKLVVLMWASLLAIIVSAIGLLYVLLHPHLPKDPR
jgi:hypothetical protein